MVPAATRTDGVVTLVRVNLELAMFLNSGGKNGSIYGVEMSAMMAHEAGHGMIQRVTGGSRTGAENKASEYEAFYTQATVNQGFGANSRMGVWTSEGGLNEKAVREWVEIGESRILLIAGGELPVNRISFAIVCSIATAALLHCASPRTPTIRTDVCRLSDRAAEFDTKNVTLRAQVLSDLIEHTYLINAECPSATVSLAVPPWVPGADALRRELLEGMSAPRSWQRSPELSSGIRRSVPYIC